MEKPETTDEQKLRDVFDGIGIAYTYWRVGEWSDVIVQSGECSLEFNFVNGKFSYITEEV